MAAIATSVDVSLRRVGVSLSGWSADGLVTVSRVHADGQRYPVRGVSAVSGGVAFGWDYEPPLSSSVTYEATDVTTVASDPVTLEAGRISTLSAPGLPSFNVLIDPIEKPAFAMARPSVSLDILGRPDPIVTMDVLKAPSFSLTVRTYSHTDAYALLSLLSVAPVLLLRMPGTFLTDWCYVVASASQPKPRVGWKPQPGSAAGSVGEWYEWELTCQVVGVPSGGVFGDPTATYQASLDAHPTYQDRLDSEATYLDALSVGAL
jgi:hypothetical protein